MLMIRRGLALLLALLLASGIGAPAAMAAPDGDIPAPASVGGGMYLEKTVADPKPLKPGDFVTYDLTIGCSSIEVPCVDAKLIDLLPPPLVVSTVTPTGFKQPVEEKYNDDRSQVELTFNEFAPDSPEEKGLIAGSDYHITIVAQLPANASAELGGTSLINEATLTSTTGRVTDPAPAVPVEIDPALKADITKAWGVPSTIAGEETANALTLGGIRNASLVGANALTILEPSGESKPFDQVAFTGFGAHTFPEGADTVTVNWFVGETKHDGVPSAEPTIPADVDLAAITGFEIIYTSSTSTTGDGAKGGIVADGTAGSLVLNTVVRPGATGVVRNETSIVATTPKGDSPVAKAENSFEITAVTFVVNATKSIAPPSVVAQTPGFEGRTENKATVSIGAVNGSNQPLQTMTIKEPSTGTDPFGAGIDFDEFVASGWPANTDSIVVTVDGTEYTLAESDGKIAFPANMPKGEAVKSFTVAFTGNYAPGESVEMKFGVIGETVGDYTNTIEAGGTSAGGTPAATGEASAPLKVVEPSEDLVGGKFFSTAGMYASDNRVEGVTGEKVNATLNTKVKDSSNVHVREIVQTDNFETMMPKWKANKVTIAEIQGASTVKVEYLNAAGTWIVLKENAASQEILDLPEGAKGVQVTYQRTEGTFPKDANVTSVVEFELTQDMAAGDEFSNNLGLNKGENTTAEVVSDKNINLGVTKSWAPGTVVQKPNNKNPESKLTLGANNSSANAVDSLKVSEPAAGTKPFDYVEITSLGVVLGDGATAELARLKLTLADGGTRELSGTEALSPAGVEGIDWANVVGFDFSLVKTGDLLVPRQASFTVNVNTKLRDTVLGTNELVDTALGKLDPAYTIPNTVDATVARDGESKDDRASAELKVITENSVEITPALTKSFNPAGPVPLFPLTPTEVTLAINSGADKADKIMVEDIDPTFWNAFDFVKWTDFASGPGNAKMTYEFFTGGTYKTVDGSLEVTGGEWTKAENLATNMNSLVDAHNGKAPMTAVEGFRITIESGNYEELARNVNTFKFQVKPRYMLRSGEINSSDDGTRNPGETADRTIANTASGKMSRLGKLHEVPDSTADYAFTPGVLGSTVTKTNNALDAKIAAGGEASYTMTVENNGTEPILDPKIVDKLPSDATGPMMGVDPDFAATTVYKLDNAFTSAKPGTTIPTDSELVSATVVDGTDVTFTFPAGTVLYPGEKYTVVLAVKVRSGLPAGSNLVNSMEFSGSNMPEPEKGESPVVVIAGQSYNSMKLVREVPSAGQTAPTGVHNVVNNRECYDFGDGFYRYPCVVETKPGGTAEWQLTVTNTGNVPTNHMEILDVFPWIGDHGVTTSQSGTPRGTKWTPTLLEIKEAELPEGATREIFYLVGDPASCKPVGDFGDGTPWSGCEDNWLSERPANPKDIMGLKAVYDFAPGLALNEGVSLTFSTESATEMPEGASELAPAWNSFGYYANAQVNGKTDHRSQEPIKTGITFRPVEKEKVSVGDYVWIDGNKDGRQDNDEVGIKDVTLVLTGPDGLPVTDVYGNLVHPTMTDKDGKYSFDNLPVLKDNESYTVTIDRTASETVLAPYHPTKAGEGNREGDSSMWVATSEGLTEDGQHHPTLDFGFVLPKVSLGDYVWVDSDRDGVQDEGEKGIKGVVLTVTGPDGNPVVDVFGNPVGPATTDDNGHYTFENLPVLKDGESYTVNIDKEGSKEPLAPYVPTVDTGADRGTNSSTWEATSEGLTEDGQHDPTLDFGFVLPKVSLGDYVWVDSDRDGVQGDSALEPGIPGVVLTITGPDGKPVTDVFGNEVGTATTDDNGHYTFENLQVLKDGESYTVSIDKEGSKEPLAPYIPTIETEGNREGDSSTWTATSEGLTQDGQSDLTLDFGFVLIPEPLAPVEPIDPVETPEPTEPANPVEPVDPTEPVAPTGPVDTASPAAPATETAPAAPAPAEKLSNTGFRSIALMGVGLLLTLGGGAVALTARRRRTSARR
ncbi:hypothetical protein CVV67_09700 [Arthrobacter stackebrandtii]|nr:hypothetical protein CVV67_09700 [Arthrobacter stackebrandtii]